MTNAKAINVLLRELQCIERNDGVQCDRKCESCDLVMDAAMLKDAYNLAISALEKQIPKKPMIKIDVFNENLWHLYCPTCGTWVGMHNKRLNGTDMHNNTNSEICAKCGQRFDLELEDNR